MQWIERFMTHVREGCESLLRAFEYEIARKILKDFLFFYDRPIDNLLAQLSSFTFKKINNSAWIL